MKPLIYGYIKVQADTPDNDVRQMELVLKDYAEREGYCFATIFYEHDTDGRALAELIQELKQADAHDVVMLSLAQLSSHPLLCDQRVALIEVDADAQIHTLSTQ